LQQRINQLENEIETQSGYNLCRKQIKLGVLIRVRDIIYNPKKNVSSTPILDRAIHNFMQDEQSSELLNGESLDQIKQEVLKGTFQQRTKTILKHLGLANQGVSPTEDDCRSHTPK
jgi:hypothetical protein